MSAAFEHFKSLRDTVGVVLDAGMGSELEARGATMDNAAWCGLTNLRNADLVQSIHEDHIRAGADVITTNTFMSGIGPMRRARVEEHWEQGARNAVRAATQAVADSDRSVVIAGSVGSSAYTSPDISAEPGESDRAVLKDAYQRLIDILVNSGVDVIALEMVSRNPFAEIAVDAAFSSGLPVWLGFSIRGAEDTTTRGTQNASEIQDDLAGWLHSDFDSVNIMHTHIDHVPQALEVLTPRWDGEIGVYPHYGHFVVPHWEILELPHAQYREHAVEWRSSGATMLGGCCGTRTAHVAALRDLVDTQQPAGRRF